MRTIREIIVHCSDTPYGKDVSAADIRAFHTKPKHLGGNGWKDIGYHFVVRLDGSVEPGRPIEIQGAHAVGHNAQSICICYIGGRDRQGKYADTRTAAQRASMLNLITDLCDRYPIASILGHRDTSPDLNHNGRIEPSEYIKACPCFNAIDEYKHLCAK